MPHHHSSHRASGTANTEAPVALAAHSMYSPHGIATEAMRGHTVAHIMRPSTHVPYSSPPYYHAGAGMVTPLKTTSWITTSGMKGPMPTLDTLKSSDSTDRSTSTKHDDCTVATLATESTPDELEKREATAALLLVSAKCQAEKDASSDASTSSISSNVPLKKRKNFDFLRPKTEAEVTSSQDPYHVSPVSHSSLGSCVAGRTISKEEISPEGAPGTASRTASYDSKESPCGNMAVAQALLDSSKINSTTEITPPLHVSIPHFPSVLHQVLSDEAFAGSIVQWMQDGESWKVLRWDAFRRQILPRFFAHLADENGKETGTIDAFLWHLTAWGFEELKDGSYRHDLFIRGAQRLCKKMNSTEIPSIVGHSNGVKAVSPLRTNRSILEVPSLSTPRPAVNASNQSNPHKRARYALGSWNSRSQETVDPSAWGGLYTEAHQVGMRHAAGQPSYAAYDQRYHMGNFCQPYSPPQVTRSGRGRMAINRPAQPSASASNTAPPRSSFPVSNRGKGNRKNLVCRSSIPRTPSNDRTSSITTPGTLEGGAQGNAVASKNKRKLPLAHNKVLN